MNKMARAVVQDRLSRSDRERGPDREHVYDHESKDYRDGYRDGYDQASYEIKGEYDKARRRSKTTGRYTRDRGESVELSKHDMMHWEKMLKNADGSKGKHFSMQDVEEMAEKLNLRFDEYSEKDFCMTMNMLYSDFCEVNRAFVSPEKEAHYYAKAAQAWLEDDDGPIGSEKLALYYYCIVDDEE